MPKRMVDGESLWTSSKLKKVRPQEFRLHYANWIPLAEANGVFEVDFDIIRSRVYPILAPNFNSKDVQSIFEEFVRVQLLQPWTDGNGKTWAYFVGIDKPGRLPGEKHVSRYKHLPPSFPGIVRDSAGNMPEGFGVGLDMDRTGIGLEDEMSAFKDKIGQLVWENFRVMVQPSDKAYPELLARARIVGGQDKLLDAFETFCKEKAHEPLQNPLYAFLRLAEGYVEQAESVQKMDKIMPELVNDLAYIADGSGIVFEKKQQVVLGRLLETYSPAAIKEAWQEFYNNLSDDFDRRHAARKFSETAEQILATQHRRREEARKTKAIIEQKILEEREKGRQEQEERQRAIDLEESLVEDTLPDETGMIR